MFIFMANTKEPIGIKYPCNKCGKMFHRHTRWNKLCDYCRDKSNKNRRKHEGKRLSKGKIWIK